MKKPNFPIVEIVWEDITAHEKEIGWVNPKDLPHEIKPCLISSVGYLLVDNASYVVYASDVAADGETNDRTQIPKSNVKSIKVLRKVPSEKVKHVIPKPQV